MCPAAPCSGCSAAAPLSCSSSPHLAGKAPAGPVLAGGGDGQVPRCPQIVRCSNQPGTCESGEQRLHVVAGGGQRPACSRVSQARSRAMPVWREGRGVVGQSTLDCRQGMRMRNVPALSQHALTTGATANGVPPIPPVQGDLSARAPACGCQTPPGSLARTQAGGPGCTAGGRRRTGARCPRSAPAPWQSLSPQLHSATPQYFLKG